MLYLASLAAAAYLLFTAQRNPVGRWFADRVDDTVEFTLGLGFSGPARLLAGVAVPTLLFSLLYAWLHTWFWGLLGAAIVVASVCAGVRFDLARRLIDDVQIDWLRGDANTAELRLEQALESWLPSNDSESLARTLTFVEKALLLALITVFSGGFYFILLGPVGIVLHLLAVFYHHRSDGARPDPVLAAVLWLPSRVLATTFLLVGDFSAGARVVGGLWTDTSLSVHAVLSRAALAAVPRLEDLDSFGDKSKLLSSFALLVDLLRRSAVVWLIVFSVWVVLL